MKMRLQVLVSVFALMAAACGASDVPTGADEVLNEPDAPSSTVPNDTTTTTLNLEAEEIVSDESELITAAIADLADRLAIDPEDIDLLQVRPVQWSDGAIGCPKEGVSYTQAIVDGVQVLLDSNGAVYDYHADDNGRVFLCESDEGDGGYSFVPPPRYDE